MNATTEIVKVEDQLATSAFNLNIANPAQMAEFVAIAKRAQEQLDAAWQLVKDQMVERGMTSVKGDWGAVLTAERINWKITDQIDEYYTKRVADTKKLAAAFAANELPAGADFTTTIYVTKRLK